MEGWREREGEGEESGGDIAEMRWRMKGGKGGEEGKGMGDSDRPRKGGRKGNAPTGEMGNFQHTLCQNDIAAAAADRRDGGHGRKWDGFYLPSIRRSITHFAFLCKNSAAADKFVAGERRRERIKRRS